jgi:hypothetical protein
LRSSILSMAVCSALLPLTGAWAQDSSVESLKNLSTELVKIRHQIESLHSQISIEKDSFRDQMRSYANQKSDLDVKISRTTLNNKELSRELDKLTESNRKQNEAHEKIAPTLKVSIATLRSGLDASLPFKLEQRKQALQEIQHRLETSIVSPNKAANQLWAWVEDELMLGRSSGIYNDTLEIDGQEKLVKVLRLGKIGLIYKTHDGRYGVVKKSSDGWTQAELADPEIRPSLESLFDSFNKNLRSGRFTIPNILSGS